ncbi:recombinase family protein [Clostridioides difficile]|uniref:recombinase family protein n=1 Tax=Clostridioides difficile TaxID=1496 RepID=UPI0021E90608|nr:recombinase family protein [Clostridioides difficile]UYJ63873.1 recombinase family protein [Clostridioides difficile]UYJ67573.1 recombinase family protein [Clostridioides difficile]WBO14026.1 recombinase family protein [Clostridioides difficile R20291]
MSKEKIKVYLYTRVSTSIQIDGYSLEAQKSRMKAFALYNDYEIVGEYEDAGKSGKSIEGRVQFTRMMEDIKSGKDGVSFVLVFKLSRFARNAADVLSTLQIMQDFGVNLICVEDGIDSSKDAGKLMISVLSAVAEIERENIRVQTMEGRIQKAKEGKWNGGFAPYGYQLIDGKLIINEEEAIAIRTIFDQYVNTSIGANGLSKYLENHGIRKIPRQNGKNPLFDAGLIRKILKNPVYNGKIAFGRRTLEKVHGTRNEYRQVEQDDYLVAEGIHEAIIPDELWQAAQVKLKAQAKKYEHVNKGKNMRTHLLSGIVKCPICGAGMFGNKSIKYKKDGTKYKDFYYYGCKHRLMNRGHKCTYNKQIREELLDDAVAEVIIKLVSNPKFASMIQEKINMKVDTSAIENEIDNYQNELRKSHSTKYKLIEEIDNLDVEDKHYKRRKNDLDDRLYRMYDKIEELESQLIEAKAKKETIEVEKLTGDNIYKVLIYFDKLYKVMNDVERRQLIEALISEIQIYEEKQPNGQWLKSITFKLPIIDEDLNISLENDEQVDGVSVPGVDPNTGFPLPDIGGGIGVEVTFDVVVESIPNPNPTNNIATIDYSYTPVEGGIPNDFSVDSNPVPVEVISADVEVTKLSEPTIVNPGEELIYTIKVVNNGPFPSENVVLTDDVPASIINPEYSLDGGVTFQPWTGSLNIGTLEVGETRVIIIRGIVNPSTVGIITNTAVVSSTTADPNLNNNTSTIETEVNLLADILVMKTAEPNSAVPGTLLRYTIQVENLGPANAENVILNDDIPASIINPEYSLDGGASFQPWNGSLNIGTLNSGISLTVLIQGTVSLNSSEYIVNTATVSSTTPDPDLSNNISTIITPVNPQAGISIIKVADEDVAVPGEEFVYTIEIFNEGPSNATNVVLTDDIPDVILNPEYSLDGGATFQPWNGSLNIGTVAPGQLIRIIIKGLVSSTATGDITNTAEVSADVPEPVTDSSTVTTPIVPSADIEVIKTSNMDTAVPGETFSYTITVINLGPSAAQSIVLTDDIPDVILNPEYSLDGGVTFQPWNGNLSIGTLDAGEIRSIIIRGTVSQTAVGTIINTATISSPTPDPNPDNNTSTDETDISPLADISVIKGNEPVAIPGGRFIYGIEIANAGPSFAENVTLTDNIPASILNPEYSIDNGVTFQPWNGSLNIGTLDAGEIRNIIIRGTVSQTAIGTIINTATVSSTTPDPNLNNNTSTSEAEVSSSADISVVKRSNQTVVVPGDVLDYTIEVINAGPSTAQNVTLTDNIPASILSPEYSIDNGVTFQPWNGSLSIGTLDAGEIRNIIIRGIVSQTAIGTIINTATVSSTTPDPNLNNNTSTSEAEVSSSADISVVKRSNQTVVVPGDVLDYTIEVINAGPSTAQNVTLTDNIPASILSPEYSIDNGVTFQPWNGSLSIGTLGAGEIRNIIIRGIVSQTAIGTIINTATVSSTTPDPNLNNNTSTSEIDISSSADISVIKLANKTEACVEEQIDFVIVVSNAGPENAQNVTLIDNVSDKLKKAVFSLDRGVSFQPWTGSLNIGTLPAGTLRVILLRGIIKSTCLDRLTNIAEVTSTTPDSNLNNNISRVQVEIKQCCCNDCCCNNCSNCCCNDCGCKDCCCNCCKNDFWC